MMMRRGSVMTGKREVLFWAWVSNAGFVVVMIGLSTSNLWIDRPMGKRVSVGGVVGE